MSTFQQHSTIRKAQRTLDIKCKAVSTVRTCVNLPQTLPHRNHTFCHVFESQFLLSHYFRPQQSSLSNTSSHKYYR